MFHNRLAGSPLTCAVGRCPAPVTVLLAHSGAIAHEATGPFAGVVDCGPECEHLSREDCVGRHPRVPTGYSLGKINRIVEYGTPVKLPFMGKPPT